MGVGPGTSNHFEAGGFVCSSDDRPYPNVMFHFLPLAVRYDGSGGGTRCACNAKHIVLANATTRARALHPPPSSSTSRASTSATATKCTWDP